MAESRRRRSLNASAAIRLFVLFVATLLGTATPVAAASPSPGASPSLSPTPPPLQPVNVPINAGAIVGLTASGSQGDHSWSAEGWGLVVDSSGLILANASVVAPDAPGTAAGYADPSVAATVSEVDIWTSPGPGRVAIIASEPERELFPSPDPEVSRPDTSAHSVVVARAVPTQPEETGRAVAQSRSLQAPAA